MKKLFLSTCIIFLMLVACTPNVFSQSCCNANFSSAGIQKLSWQFFPEDSADAGSFTWKWEFGDGKISHAIAPAHQYSRVGGYLVKLTKTRQLIINYDTVTASCSISKNVSIYKVSPPISCIAQFSLTQNSNVVTLTNGSTVSTTKKKYRWDFGDHTTSVLANPSHTYLTPGTYTIKLTVTATGSQTSETCTDTAQVIIPGATPCLADFNYQSIGTDGTYYFSTQDTLYNYFSYWTFGDGSAVYGLYPTHKYSFSGTYTVCQYKGKDTSSILAKGCMVCHPINVVVDSTVVHPPTDSCFATFSYQTLSNTVFFNADSLKSGEYSYYNFGDGNFGSGNNVSHAYASSGSYSVTRTMIKNTFDTNGNVYFDSCTAVQTVIISTQPVTDSCFAGFTYSFSGDTLKFVPNTTTGIHNWSFGDGTSSSGSVVQHLYNAEATYNVCHYAQSQTDSCLQCMTIAVKKPTVSPNPSDGFINVSSVQDSIVSYILMNNAGATVAQQNNLNTLQTSIPVQNLPSGYYTLKVIFGPNRYAFYNVLIQH